MYKCKNCGKTFSEEDVKKEYISYSDFYGIEEGLGTNGSVIIWHCPKCDSEDIEEYEEEMEEE